MMMKSITHTEYIKTIVMKLLLLLTVWLSHVSYVECWSIRQASRGEHNLPSRTRRALASTPLFPSPSSSSCLHSQSDDKDASSSTSPTVLYNDDAFGLVFLSSLFVAKDYTFAATFASLSFLAVIMVQFAGVTFTPLAPGFVALMSLFVTAIVGNGFELTDVIPEDIALPVEVAASAVSLAWGFIQTTRDDKRDS